MSSPIPYTPNHLQARMAYERGGMRTGASVERDCLDAEFDRFIAQVCTAAWDEGHKSRWRRGDDDCKCEAWSSGECGCGLYGTGKLVSLADNPYRIDNKGFLA